MFFFRRKKGKLSVQTSEELRTLARAIDLVLKGDITGLGDLLMQRYKAVEHGATHGWQAARHLQLLPAADVTAVSARESEIVSHLARQDDRARARGSGNPR